MVKQISGKVRMISFMTFLQALVFVRSDLEIYDI